MNAEQAAATVAISLLPNLLSYVWVAEIRQGTGEAVVVMVSAPRPAGMTGAHESVPLSLRKIPLWTQDDPILDVAVLEENATPTHITVLDGKSGAVPVTGRKVAAGAGTGPRAYTTSGRGICVAGWSPPEITCWMFICGIMPRSAAAIHLTVELPRD